MVRRISINVFVVTALDQIEETTPRNKVLVRLLRRQFDSATISALMQLPQEEALTDYLKAMRLCLQYQDVYTMCNKSFNLAEDPNLLSFGEEATVYEVAKFYLKRCFEKDSNFINFAKGDSGINELLLNEILK